MKADNGIMSRRADNNSLFQGGQPIVPSTEGSTAKVRGFKSPQRHRCNQRFSSKLPPTQVWVTRVCHCWTLREIGSVLAEGRTTTEASFFPRLAKWAALPLAWALKVWNLLARHGFLVWRVPELEFLLFTFKPLHLKTHFFPWNDLLFPTKSFMMCCYRAKDLLHVSWSVQTSSRGDEEEEQSNSITPCSPPSPLRPALPSTAVDWRERNARCVVRLLSQTVCRVTPGTIKGSFVSGMCNAFLGLVSEFLDEQVSFHNRIPQMFPETHSPHSPSSLWNPVSSSC